MYKKFPGTIIIGVLNKLPMSVVLMLQENELGGKNVVTPFPMKSRKLDHVGEMILNRKHKMPKVTF